MMVDPRENYASMAKKTWHEYSRNIILCENINLKIPKKNYMRTLQFQHIASIICKHYSFIQGSFHGTDSSITGLKQPGPSDLLSCP